MVEIITAAGESTIYLASILCTVCNDNTVPLALAEVHVRKFYHSESQPHPNAGAYPVASLIVNSLGRTTNSMPSIAFPILHVSPLSEKTSVSLVGCSTANFQPP